MPVFYMDAGDPISGPHACTESGLPTNSDPQACSRLLRDQQQMGFLPKTLCFLNQISSDLSDIFPLYF